MTKGSRKTYTTIVPNPNPKYPVVGHVDPQRDVNGGSRIVLKVTVQSGIFGCPVVEGKFQAKFGCFTDRKARAKCKEQKLNPALRCLKK